MVDILTEILTLLQVQSMVYCQSQINRQDWALQFTAVRGAAFHIVSEGWCWLITEGQSLALGTGDVVILPQGTAHVIADAPQSTPRAVIDFDDGLEHPCQLLRWGDGAVNTVLICGLFRCEEYAGLAMLPMLSPVLHFAAETSMPTSIQRAAWAVIEEANADRPGKLAVLHRLSDILFVEVVRAWLSQPELAAEGWLAGLRDPRIAASIRAIHAQPAHRWTISTLARQAAMSRSAFAAHFTQVVGVPPAHYLANWRIQTSKRLLRDPRLSLSEIAGEVGYNSDIAFSKAFKRLTGISPAGYRRGVINKP
jgi:AraC-like DNA-binding protein